MRRGKALGMLGAIADTYLTASAANNSVETMRETAAGVATGHHLFSQNLIHPVWKELG